MYNRDGKQVVRFNKMTTYVWATGLIEISEQRCPEGAIEICYALGTVAIDTMTDAVRDAASMRDFGDGNMRLAVPGIHESNDPNQSVDTLIEWSDDLRETLSGAGKRIIWHRK